jgi:hypothetical protein
MIEKNNRRPGNSCATFALPDMAAQTERLPEEAPAGRNELEN